MVVFPNAKINIGLSVIRKRGDGFHDIESVFYPVGLCDALEYLPLHEETRADTDIITYSGEFKVSGKDICLKLIELLRKSYSFPVLRLHLYKNIPAGAGLGGGSSDAAFLLKSLNSRFNFGLTNRQLEDLAGSVGSDCPFFINNKPSLVTGRGEKMEDLKLNLEGFFIVLVCPGINISTADAYRQVTPLQKSPGLQELVMENINSWKHLIINQFEEPVFKIYPEIGRIKKKLYQMGAVFASMTGSGSAVYGIFRSEPDILGKFSNYFVYRERLR